MEDDHAAQADPPSRLAGDDGEDRIPAALDFLRGIRPAGGEPHWETDTAGQKVRLQEWARSSVDPGILIPFDVIPVQPDGGFLDFIRDTLIRGATLSVVRTTHTTSRVLT